MSKWKQVAFLSLLSICWLFVTLKIARTGKMFSQGIAVWHGMFVFGAKSFLWARALCTICEYELLSLCNAYSLKPCSHNMQNLFGKGHFKCLNTLYFCSQSFNNILCRKYVFVLKMHIPATFCISLVKYLV